MSSPPTKPTHYPCNVCGEQAVACLRPDMDIKGLCFCEEHRKVVYMVYTMILQDNMNEEVEHLMKDWKHK